MAQRAFDIVVNVDTRQADRQLNNFDRQLRDTQRQLQSLGDSVSTGNLQRFGNAANDATAEVRDLDSAASSLDTNFGNLGASFSGLGGEAGSLAGSFVEMAQTMAIVNTTATISREQIAQLDAAMNGAWDAIERLDDALHQGTISVEAHANAEQNLEDNIHRTEAALRSATQEYERQNTTMGRLRRVLGNTKVQVAAIGVAAVIAASQMAKLTQQMVTMSGLDAKEFQIFAGATAQYGINAEQAANLVKDFNDKIGDFIITGGGPMVDVMDRLTKSTGLTIDQLAGLSGPDGLIAVKKAMDDANLSTQEQTFILESLGSDLTLLQPLLKNNGKALKEFAGEFDTLAAVTQKGTIATLNSLSNEWNDTLALTKNLFMEMAAVVAPVFELLLAGLNKIIGLTAVWFRELNIGLRATALALLEYAQTFDLLKENETIKEWIIDLKALNEVLNNNESNQQALFNLRQSRANKEIGDVKKLITAQIDLASAAGTSVEAYENLLWRQERLNKLTAKRIELEKQGFNQDQIEDILLQYDLLEIAVKHTNDELQRRNQIESIITGQQNQLELLRARNEEERRWIELQQQISNTALSNDERAQIETLHAQILAQEEMNRVLAEQEQAYEDLGSAVTKWALGSEDAILSVIANLVKLIALSNGFDQNPFIKGFLGGLQGFANGGTFGAGETFMVGEKGPEIITSSAAGRVIPNHQLGGMGTNSFSQNISLSINGSIVASEELDRKFEEFAGAVAENTNSLLRNQLRTGGVLA